MGAMSWPAESALAPRSADLNGTWPDSITVSAANYSGVVALSSQRLDEGVLIDRRIDVPIGIGRNPDR